MHTLNYNYLENKFEEIMLILYKNNCLSSFYISWNFHLAIVVQSFDNLISLFSQN